MKVASKVFSWAVEEFFCVFAKWKIEREWKRDAYLRKKLYFSAWHSKIVPNLGPIHQTP